jgi:hypothetical protein
MEPENQIGASEGIRTLDIHVGNVTLYQTELRSLPEAEGQFRRLSWNDKPEFRPVWVSDC